MAMSEPIEASVSGTPEPVEVPTMQVTACWFQRTEQRVVEDGVIVYSVDDHTEVVVDSNGVVVENPHAIGVTPLEGCFCRRVTNPAAQPELPS
jgi:hypothetical protein